jgi:hypothetical protein
MLVINLAHHGFDDVFKGHQSVHPAEFVDHHGHVDAVGLHPHHEIGGAHGGGHIERGAFEPRQNLGGRVHRLGRVGQEAKDVLQVGHAHGVVQGLAIDRNA